MKREEWVDREIRTVVQGIHHMLGVGRAGEEPVSPLTISGNPPPDEETGSPVSPVADEAAPASAETAPPAPATGGRRAARRKHKRDRR